MQRRKNPLHLPSTKPSLSQAAKHGADRQNPLNDLLRVLHILASPCFTIMPPSAIIRIRSRSN